MDWDECLEGGVRTKRPDMEEAKALLKMAEKREEYIKAIGNPREFASLIVEGYYEIIKELITAIMSVDGYKSYSRECLITFIEKFYGFSKDRVVLLDQLRRIRNDINYRGASVDYSYLERNQAPIKGIIIELKKVLKRRYYKASHD